VKFEVRIAGEPHAVELDRDAARWRISLDGRAVEADAIELAPGIYSILLDGLSHEVRVTPSPDGTLQVLSGIQEFTAEVADPRSWRGRRHATVEAKGRQPITAPMPGKVVRILVQAGDPVEAGQGILVVEAMKMQNEIKSPKSGKVVRLLAKEGQTVNAGDILAWVE
jgi:biotin carboxyl carrier protein